MFERALMLYQRVADVRGEAQALFWVGIVHQVVRHDSEGSVPSFLRSLNLAGQFGDGLTMSYALRHLGNAEHLAGRLDVARDRLEESTRPRREIGFLPGVAANLIGLAFVAQDSGHSVSEVATLLDEATAIAEVSGAHGILRSIGESRTTLLPSVDPPPRGPQPT